MWLDILAVLVNLVAWHVCILIFAKLADVGTLSREEKVAELPPSLIARLSC